MAKKDKQKKQQTANNDPALMELRGSILRYKKPLEPLEADYCKFCERKQSPSRPARDSK
jgi:hypothetical protein